MKNFIKNKSIGYYLACAVAVLTIVLIIVFYATIGVPGTGATSMPNSAAAKSPETIGVFAIAGLIAQVALLAVPEFSVIQFVALILFGLSFYKELICCPQVLAAIVTGVAYEGGSLEAHLTYLILFVLIFGLAIAGAFIGYFKKDEDAAEGYRFKKDGKVAVVNVAKTGGAAAVLLAAVLVSTISANALESAAASRVPPEFDPIPAEVKEAAAAYEYDFEPADVHFTKEDLATGEKGTFDFSSAAGISSLPTNGVRENVHLVYKFEGSYAEGWQGDYSKTYAYLYLWEDGKFAGTSGSTQFRGYWYDNGDASTLVMVTSNNADGEIIAYEAKGFYKWIVDLNSSVNGGRRIKANGYLYYPEVGIFIDTADADLSSIYAGASLDISGWTAQRVLKNLKYSSCYETNNKKVSWKVNGSNISNSTINCAEVGEYKVTATWTNDNKEELTAEVVFNVTEAPEVPVEE